jgi:hypothetical protein
MRGVGAQVLDASCCRWREARTRRASTVPDCDRDEAVMVMLVRMGNYLRAVCLVRAIVVCVDGDVVV